MRNHPRNSKPPIGGKLKRMKGVFSPDGLQAFATRLLGTCRKMLGGGGGWAPDMPLWYVLPSSQSFASAFLTHIWCILDLGTMSLALGWVSF